MRAAIDTQVIEYGEEKRISRSNSFVHRQLLDERIGSAALFFAANFLRIIIQITKPILGLGVPPQNTFDPCRR